MNTSKFVSLLICNTHIVCIGIYRYNYIYSYFNCFKQAEDNAQKKYQDHNLYEQGQHFGDSVCYHNVSKVRWFINLLPEKPLWL